MKQQRASVQMYVTSPKASPFKGYQEELVKRRIETISSHIAVLKKSRAKFKYKTDLAKAVAAHLSLVEGKPCSFTTLLRNKVYENCLTDFMADSIGAGEVRITEPAVQSVVRAIELELGNINNDNIRLRAYIAELENKLDEQPTSRAISFSQLTISSELIQLSNEKAMVCKALWMMLEHFKDLVTLDMSRKCIIDLAAPTRNNIVVDTEVAEVFFEWAKRSSKIVV